MRRPTKDWVFRFKKKMNYILYDCTIKKSKGHSKIVIDLSKTKEK